MGILTSAPPHSAFSIWLSAPKPVESHKWFYVDRRFERLFSAMDATPSQITDYRTKLEGLCKCLNDWYWPELPQGNSTFIIAGSWAKGTQARTCSDIDIIFLLPWAVKQRFDGRNGNRQSQILQEVKNVLLPSYPKSSIKGDGPTVVVDFDTIKVEIAPVFLDLNGSRFLESPDFRTWVCHTKDDGEYKLSAPAAEIQKLSQINLRFNGNLAPLLRMIKVWRKTCNIPIKSIVAEQIAMDFLSQWYGNKYPYFWPDWLMRDFLEYMLLRANGWSLLPGTREVVYFGNEWVGRTQTALRAVQKACEYEQNNQNSLAGEEWQKIFGIFIPKEA